jgi:hypothetical protein
MLAKLFILLIWPERYAAIALNVAAFVFAALAAGAAHRLRNVWRRGLAAVARGLGLQAASGLVRLGVEVVSDAPRLPGWFVSGDRGAYYAGQAFLVLGLYLV